MTPKALLDQFTKLTPSETGRWNRLEGCVDLQNADIVVVLEGLPQKFNREQLTKKKQVICIPLEPTIIRATKNFPLN